MTPPRPETLLDTASLPVIVIHGGAGMRPGTPPGPVVEGVREAAAVGFAVLAGGGSALDAVEAAVAFLEDHPLFNAGRGSCLTSAGTVEMDASLMDGASLEAGAVANVARIRNPIRLARGVMEKSDHLLLMGVGAEKFAEEIGGIDFTTQEWLVVPEQRARWEQLKAEAGARPDRRKLGTVGAVAVDRNGHVAAATSTGGTAFKRPGRVGDSPLVGAGTYADDASGAVSCTGHGESIIRLVLAKATCDAIQRGESPREAAESAAAHLKARVNGDGGLIVVGPDGRAGWATNTPAMSRAIMRSGMDAPFASL